ncbi:MAG: hypothetical protein QW835_01665 [Candidatus Hadarchaeum sp.]|uniref:hypothetical protein n=1 Tax=Candidatus Hadarchaeum sp. TaxID=2883567 RepID=UPI00317CA24B
MVRKLRVESILTALDEIVELNPGDLGKGSRLLRSLDWYLEQLLEAARIDEERRKGLFRMVTLVRSSSAKLFQSLGNAKQSGQLRGDWLRFAQHDFLKLKEDLIALREHLVENVDFFRLACLRDQIGELASTRPEKLFEELHEAGVISERTWVLLMSCPVSWREMLGDGEISKQISKLSAWLLELQEIRKRQRTA